MREREALLEQRRRLQNKEEHLYERVTPRRLSEDCPNERQQNRFNKSTSLPSYNGSEMSIDNELIYSPCSYYGSESEIVDGSEWSGCNRPCKLRCRKGRSIVHKNLEDNYGAVVVANREALAQVLENVSDLLCTFMLILSYKSFVWKIKAWSKVLKKLLTLFELTFVHFELWPKI